MFLLRLNAFAIVVFIGVLAFSAGCLGTSPASTTPNQSTAGQLTPTTPITPPVTPAPAQNTSNAAPQATGQGPNDIWMSGDVFLPAKLTVAVGTTVTWTNKDYDLHTITSYDGLFDSGPIDFGQKFSFVFSKPGTFNFYCKPHPDMIGSVVVK